MNKWYGKKITNLRDVSAKMSHERLIIRCRSFVTACDGVIDWAWGLDTLTRQTGEKAKQMRVDDSTGA